MRNIRFALSLAMITTLLSSCGGGDSDSGSSWTGQTNSSGFPEVAGTYSLIADGVKYTCTDNSSGEVGPISVDVAVTESANVLTIRNSNAQAELPGVTVLQTTDNTGDIAHDATFTTTKTLTAQVAGLTGNVVYDLTLQGQFSPSGWAGNYNITFTPV
jgi:hypothetical protein